MANYGASQGVDNDDGSSYYNITDNINIGEGFKMDYGGHDSTFTKNLVVVRPYDGQNCYNLGDFKSGHIDRFEHNVCLLQPCGQPKCDEIVGHYLGPCAEADKPILGHNRYYTIHGNASVECGGEAIHPLQELQDKYGTEKGSIISTLPSDDQIIAMVKQCMQRWSLDQACL